MEVIATRSDMLASVRKDLMGDVTPDVVIFGLTFWNASFEEFANWWRKVLENEARACCTIAFANANTLNHAATNVRFRTSLENIDVRVNDGIGFKIASKIRGVPVKCNLNGTDLIPSLLANSAHGVSVFIYGATEESNQRAAQMLVARYPHIRIAGRCSGYVDEQSVALPMIEEAAADVLLVALGNPRQEIFCQENRNRLNAKLVVPVGGLVDFIAEIKPRAPKIFRQVGMEWLYRLALEPKRMFVRYVLGNPIFIIRSFLHARRDRGLLNALKPGKQD